MNENIYTMTFYHESKNIYLYEVLIQAKLARSASEARRHIAVGNVKINNEFIKDMNFKIDINSENIYSVGSTKIKVKIYER